VGSFAFPRRRVGHTQQDWGAGGGGEGVTELRRHDAYIYIYTRRRASREASPLWKCPKQRAANAASSSTIPCSMAAASAWSRQPRGPGTRGRARTPLNLSSCSMSKSSSSSSSASPRLWTRRLLARQGRKRAKIHRSDVDDRVMDPDCVCVFITAGPSTKLFAWGGGGYGRTCASRDDEPRPVWTSLPITRYGVTASSVAPVHFFSAEPLKTKHLRLAAQRKINSYRQQYADNQNISFLPAIMTTSSRMRGEFLRLLFLQAHRETTAHFNATGLPFRFKRAAFYMGLKSKVGLVAATASALRINLNIQGCSVVAPPLHAPSHAPSSPPPSFPQYPSPPRSLARDGQTSSHWPRLVVSRSTCPPWWSPPCVCVYYCRT
jgi:hypothetical protein